MLFVLLTASAIWTLDTGQSDPRETGVHQIWPACPRPVHACSGMSATRIWPAGAAPRLTAGSFRWCWTASSDIGTGAPMGSFATISATTGTGSTRTSYSGVCVACGSSQAPVPAVPSATRASPRLTPPTSGGARATSTRAAVSVSLVLSALLRVHRDRQDDTHTDRQPACATWIHPPLLHTQNTEEDRTEQPIGKAHFLGEPTSPV